MAQPATAEVRVSCPACGGAIHPIAGRCKHCKADLVTARGGATAAMGSVIQLGALATPAASNSASVPLVAGPSASGAATIAPDAVSPVVVVNAPARAPRRRSWRRQWPLAVAAIAALAILVSVGILMFGGGDDKKSRRRRALGPAPDRMQTDQLPDDPRAQPGAGSQHQPLPQAPQTPPDLDVDPGAGGTPGGGLGTPGGGLGTPGGGLGTPGGGLGGLAPVQPDDPDDPDQDPGGVVGGVMGGTPAPAQEFLRKAIDTACDRLSTCWGSGGSRQMCQQLKALSQQTFDSFDMCPRFDAAAGDRCLRQLASIPCPDDDASAQDLLGMAAGFDDCLRVCQ